MIPFLRFSRTYLLRYWHWYLAGAVALLATNWLSVEIPLQLARGIDALAPGGGGTPVILRSAATVAGMGAVVIVVRTASRLLFFTPGRLVEAQVKRDLFEHLLRHQAVFLDQWPTGDLVSRASTDVNMVRLLGGFTFLGVVNTVVAFATAGTQMARISPALAAWILVPLVLAFGVTVVAVGRLRDVMDRMMAQSAELSDHVLSSYQGVPCIHAFRAEDAFRARFGHVNDALLGTMLERANYRALIGPVLSLAASTAVFLLLWIGGPMAIQGDLTVGELVAFTTLVAYLTGPLRGLSFIVGLIKQAQSSIERLEAILVPAPDRPDLPDPTPPPAAPPRLEIRGLTFAYPDAPDHVVLADLSVEVPPGGTLGILGSTGAGKSTLLRCVTRLYNPPPGTVFVNGVDVRSLDLDAWRRRVTFVPQRAFLFSEPVRDNILLGAPDDGRLEAALRLAQLEADLESLPDGVDTTVGEAGLTLSGGQRQRVALARGLIRPHEVLILDDVLSAVDHATEQALIAAIRTGHRPTTLLVAHRISAIQHADRILVLEGGRVVDVGTHDELARRPGLYRDIWDRQREAE